MKRMLSLLLILMLLVSIAACQQQVPAGIAFYYCAAQPDYSTGSTAISPEYRNGVPTDSLPRAMEYYLSGPISENLKSPFPENLKLVDAHQKNGTLYLTFSNELAFLSGLDLTIACGCLTLTALSITGAEQVEISTVTGLLDGQRAIIMDKNTLLLLDTAVEGE